MPIQNALAMRLNPLEKASLRELANRLQRSQTQVVRDLVMQTLAILKEQDAAQAQPKPTTRTRANPRGG